jgi:hypothetical protein
MVHGRERKKQTQVPGQVEKSKRVRSADESEREVS